MKLSDADRHAVDLLLDRGQSSAVREGGPGYAASSGLAAKRVQHVQALLNLLDELPVQEPPDDLAARTMDRVQRDSASDAMRIPAAAQDDSHHTIM